MGAWGTSIFSDDFACDVRDEYRSLLESGASDAKAFKDVVAEFREDSKDYDDGPIFWLALAATQWKLGRLDDKVKTKALKLIESGIALKRWLERSEGKSATARQTVLEKLATQIRSTQPARKEFRKPTAKKESLKRPKFGDIFEIPTKKGLAYGQYTHFHEENYGELVRVFDKLFRKRADRFFRSSSVASPIFSVLPPGGGSAKESFSDCCIGSDSTRVATISNLSNSRDSVRRGAN